VCEKEREEYRQKITDKEIEKQREVIDR